MAITFKINCDKMPDVDASPILPLFSETKKLISDISSYLSCTQIILTSIILANCIVTWKSVLFLVLRQNKSLDSWIQDSYWIYLFMIRLPQWEDVDLIIWTWIVLNLFIHDYTRKIPIWKVNLYNVFQFRSLISNYVRWMLRYLYDMTI